MVSPSWRCWRRLAGSADQAGEVGDGDEVRLHGEDFSVRMAWMCRSRSELPIVHVAVSWPHGALPVEMTSWSLRVACRAGAPLPVIAWFDLRQRYEGA